MLRGAGELPRLWGNGGKCAIVRSMNKDMVKFALVGAVSTVIDFALFSLLAYWGLTLFWAIFVGYLIGAANGYVLNNRWTYGHLEKPTTFAGFLKYATISFVGLGLTEIIVYALFQWLHINTTVDKLVAVVIVFSWNYTANRVFTFQGHKAKRV